MENLNKQLDKEVIKRTKYLNKNWNERVKALERYSTVGKITTGLLHDIKTPLSSLSLSIELYEQKHSNSLSDKEFQELKNSYSSLLEIFHETEQLLKNPERESQINITETIKNAVSIVESSANKNNIVIKTDLIKNAEITGVSVILLRIVLNLLMNSIEELSSIQKDFKNINISLNSVENLNHSQPINKKALNKESHNKSLNNSSQLINKGGAKKGQNNELYNNYAIKIRDNGSGISKTFIEKIFNEGFGLKNNERNYGLGLSFVKNSVEEYFKGEVSVLSENKGEKSFTEFILIIPIKSNELNNKKTD